MVVGHDRPQPTVRGRGIRRLRRAGIVVTTGVLKELCQRTNEDFAVAIRTGLPFVTLKLAASPRRPYRCGEWRCPLDQRSGLPSQVHVLRNQVDAILVGAETVQADDPQLTCRIRGGRDPLRVILDGRLRISPQAQVCRLSSKAATVIATTRRAAQLRGAAFERSGVEILAFPGKRGKIPLRPVLETLAQRGAKHVLSEGCGSRLRRRPCMKGLVQKVLFFYGAVLLGGDGRAMLAPLGIGRVAEGIKLHTMQVDRSGNDVVVSGYIRT